VIKKDTRRTVQLIDDHPFRPVNDEGTVFRHQRNFAEVNFLFLDIADLLGFGRFTGTFPFGGAIGLKHNQPDHDLQGSRVGHSFLNTFFHIIPDITQFIAHKFQRTFPAEIRNRKNALESTLQTESAPLHRCNILLEKFLVRLCLNID